METSWLDDVLVLLEERNLTRAAARRNVTQPAFSRRIRGFEAWLGRPILARGSNSIALDPALEASEAEIRALLAQLSDLRTRIARHDPSVTRLRIAAQHAPLSSRFPEMAARARQAVPGLRLRVHARNLEDGASLLLRGAVSMLLCHEARSEPLRFGAGVTRGVHGRDDLIPVVGGVLRAIAERAQVPPDLPAIVYPEASYFGSVLGRAGRRFATAAAAESPVCETAFSAGIVEMATAGLGVAWLPGSMVGAQLQAGTLVSLAKLLGSEPLEVAVYADIGSPMARTLLALWARG